MLTLMSLEKYLLKNSIYRVWPSSLIWHVYFGPEFGWRLSKSVIVSF